MRLRNVPGSREFIEDNKYAIKDPESYYGKWRELFGKDITAKLHIEIGMGKGKFIIENAMKYKDINFIGIEKFDSIVARSLLKIPDDLDNLYIVRMDALNIDKVFAKEIDRIYLNFSDPWPKVRHHLRRLSSKVFLDKYDSIFKNKKEIFMRTDNRDLYIYSLMSFSEHGYKLRDISFDLHEKEDENLITTEYEDKFSSKGMPIYSVIADDSVQNSK